MNRIEHAVHLLLENERETAVTTIQAFARKTKDCQRLGFDHAADQLAAMRCATVAYNDALLSIAMKYQLPHTQHIHLEDIQL